MQHILKLLSIFVGCVFLANAEESYPDISMALQGGKLVSKLKHEGIAEGYEYSYESNVNFEALKERLKKFLGQNWTEVRRDPTSDEAIKKAQKELGMDIENLAVFSNPRFLGAQIRMTNKKIKSKDSSYYIIGIVIIYGKSPPK